MKVLHTSDWHLGQSLMDHRRKEEFELFLSWLIDTINRDKIDILMISGDIFDTANPPHEALEMYYNFLCQLSRSSCRHSIIIGGNHDSGALLDASRSILKIVHVHVIGSACKDARDEVICIEDENGQPALIVCAVPFLREGDVHTAPEPGETPEMRENAMRQGVAAHYHAAAAKAEEIRGERDIPVIAMGHLYASGGTLSENIRTTYVGNLGGVGADTFGSSFDYVALGHLHIPQLVGECETVRYSGSPIPMSFGEADQQKSVCEIEFIGRKPHVTTVNIPLFRMLASIKDSSIEGIRSQIQNIQTELPVWLDIVYTGEQRISDFRDKIKEIVSERNAGSSQFECIGSRCERTAYSILHTVQTQTYSVESLTPQKTFDLLLDRRGYTNQEDRHRLWRSYSEILESLDDQQ